MAVSNAFLDGLDSGKFAPFLSASELGAIAEFAARLPLAVSTHALELRLGDGENQADYAVCLTDEPTVLETVRACLENPPGALFSAEHLKRLLADWVVDADGVRTLAPLLWLEFDRPEQLFAHPPGVFLAIGNPATASANGIARLLSCLYDSRHAAMHRDHLERLVSALSEGAAIRHIGALPSRHPAFLRLVVEGMGSAWGTLLDRISWPGDVVRVSAMLDELIGFDPTLMDFDYSPGLGTRLGFEYLLVGDEAPADGGAALLDVLCSRGLCTPDKRDALMRSLSWNVRDSGSGALWDKLYHVKLVVTQDDAAGATPDLSAKAYWGVWSGPRESMLTELHTAMQARLSE